MPNARSNAKAFTRKAALGMEANRSIESHRMVLVRSGGGLFTVLFARAPHPWPNVARSVA